MSYRVNRTAPPRGRPGRLVGALLWAPVGLGGLVAALVIALRVGALDGFPWPQQLAFAGDPDAFIACFEERAGIASKRGATFVTRFSERPEGAAELLVKMGGDLGRDGLRALELLRQDSGFELRDRHYSPDHSPLSQPMKKQDWITAWRCAQGGE